MPRPSYIRRFHFGNLVLAVVLTFATLAMVRPVRAEEIPSSSPGGLPLGLGDREPTPEEAAYVETRMVTTDRVEPNALARARAVAHGGAEGDANPADALPTSVDNSTLVYMPPIRSQGGQGSCTAWASAYYYSTYTQARDHGIDVSGGDNTNISSPAFLYPLVNGGVDGGAYTPYVVALLNDTGCATWDSMPYSQSDYTTWPTEAAWLEALTWRTDTSYQINGSSPSGLAAIKQHLSNGNVAVTRFSVYATWYYNYPSNTTGINNKVYYAHDGSYLGGHAVTIVGYDDNRSYVDHRDGQTHYGAFLIANSWGSGWGWYNSTGTGSKGFFWVAYDMFLDSDFGPYAYYNSDRPDYEPTFYAAAGINHTQRGRVVVRGGIGPTGSPDFNSPYPIYYDGGNTLAITDSKRVVVDLTDGAGLYSLGQTKQAFVRLTVSGAASSNGTMTSADFYSDFDDDGIFETTASTDPTVTVAPGSTDYATADVSYGQSSVYVDDSNTTGPWYGTYTYPYQTIQDGLDAAGSGEQVIVMDGTYTGSENRNLNFGGVDVVLVADDGPDGCVIDCENAGRAFVFQTGETSAAVVDGFTIVNGDVVGNGGAISIVGADPTIQNCVIYGSRAVGFGGAVFVSNSESTFINCIVTGNLADGYFGGGFYIGPSPDVTLVNCTIAGNSATNGGGLYVAASGVGDPTLTNCIVWNNVPNSISDAAATTVNYSNVESGWAGAGGNNVSGDPLFYDDGEWNGSTWTQGDYHLIPGSPCIDSGFGDDGTTVPATDAFGLSRMDDADVGNTGSGTPDYVDMGARERQGTWAIVAVGDFNGNGRDDILWFNSSTGYAGVWLLYNTSFAGGGCPGAVDPASGWTVKDVGDFNGDGKDDILWRETATGEVGIWFMNGVNLGLAVIVTTVDPATNYEIRGAGDLNGDGKADIVWRNTATGAVAVWLMNGSSISTTGVPHTVDPASGYAIQDVIDFNNDGNADLLWRKSTTGEVAVWLMNGTTLNGGGSPGTVDPASTWTLMGAGDFNGDGRGDILWYDSSNGYVAIWLLNGMNLMSGGVAAAVDPADGWTIQGIGDFNHDGKADILWQNATSGSVAVWLMNGYALKGGAIVLTTYP